MSLTATTVGAYLRDLPPDRRVAMARVCSMIRRSARGVRESMRYGLAFYELDGPLFALESGRKHMSLYVAEQDVVLKHKDAISGVDAKRSYIKFSDLNRYRSTSSRRSSVTPWRRAAPASRRAAFRRRPNCSSCGRSKKKKSRRRRSSRGL